jgi:ribosomal protein S18 acetylase RimI-like enzyme
MLYQGAAGHSNNTFVLKNKLMTVTLRPVVASDEDFLFEVYAGTRRDEVAAWGWDAAQQNMFLKMQFNVQRRVYEAQYPQDGHHLILLDDEPVGRLWVVRSDEEIHLVDIALLPAHRGQGIGGSLVQELLDEAARAGQPCRLQVLKSNPAARLYARLGFVQTGENGLYCHMEWRHI